jgi:SSS family transporter
VLSAVDYAVIAGYLAAITAFGSWFARFQKTTRDYFLNDRSVPWWAICFTIVATETSTLSFIGVPAAAFAGNMTFLQLAMGYIVGRLIVSAIFIPAYARGELVTSYQLLQQRFGPEVQSVAAGLFLLTRSLADGIRLFATALVIAVVTGVPVTLTVVVLGLAMIVYTTRGGVAAVIWTDVVQMFVYVAGALVVFAALLARIPGGWATVAATGAAAAKFTVFDFSTDPAAVYTLWAGLIGGVCITLATHGTDQYLVQRLLSARSAREASTGLVLSGFVVFVQFVLFLLIGVMLYTYYQQAPLPALGRNDEILPRFVLDHLSHGPAGFIVAAIVAAALSPSLNAMAATTVNDFYKRYGNPRADEATLMRISRGATIGWGLVQLLVAIAAQWMDRGVLDAGLAVLSLTTGPVLGAFLVGVLTTRVGSRAMLAGMAVGLVTLAFVWWRGAVAWTWYAFIGAGTTGLAALAASTVTREARRPASAS